MHGQMRQGRFSHSEVLPGVQHIQGEAAEVSLGAGRRMTGVVAFVIAGSLIFLAGTIALHAICRACEVPEVDPSDDPEEHW